MDILEFPTELLLHIFEKLHPQQLLRCTWVCSNWRRTASCNILWKKVLLRHGSLERVSSHEDYIEHRKHMNRWRHKKVHSKEIIWRETSPRSEEGDSMFLQSRGKVLLLAFSSGRIEIWKLTHTMEFLCSYHHPGRITNLHLFDRGVIVCEDKKFVLYMFMNDEQVYVNDESARISFTHEFEDSIHSHMFGEYLVCACRHTIYLFSVHQDFCIRELKVPHQYFSKDMQSYKVVEPVLVSFPYVFGCSVDQNKDAWLLCWKKEDPLWVVFTGERIPKLWFKRENRDGEGMLYMCNRRGTRVSTIKVSTGAIIKELDIEVDDEDEEELEVEISFLEDLLVVCTCSLSEIQLYNLTGGQKLWKGRHPDAQLDSLLHKSLFHGDFFITVSWDTLYIWDVTKRGLALVLAVGYPPFMVDMLVRDDFLAIGCASQDDKLFRLFLLSTGDLQKFQASAGLRELND